MIISVCHSIFTSAPVGLLLGGVFEGSEGGGGVHPGPNLGGTGAGGRGQGPRGGGGLTSHAQITPALESSLSFRTLKTRSLYTVHLC